MTVKEMIKQLKRYPTYYQVVDTEGSPIMYMVCRCANAVTLEPKTQIDKKSWLDDFLQEALNSTMSDDDVAQELKDQGFTLDDLKEYRQDTYEWAKQYWKESDGNENME